MHLDLPTGTYPETGARLRSAVPIARRHREARGICATARKRLQTRGGLAPPNPWEPGRRAVPLPAAAHGPGGSPRAWSVTRLPLMAAAAGRRRHGVEAVGHPPVAAIDYGQGRAS